MARREVDHKLLLMKYMDWMIDQHGEDFVYDERWQPPTRFKVDEWEELKRLSQIIAGVNEAMPKITIEPQGIDDE